MQISGNIRPQRVCHNKRDVNGELAPKKTPKRYVQNAKLHRRKLQPARAYASHTHILIKHPPDEKCAKYETKNKPLAICTICDHTQINMEVLSACHHDALVLHSEFTVIVQLCNSQSAFCATAPHFVNVRSGSALINYFATGRECFE